MLHTQLLLFLFACFSTSKQETNRSRRKAAFYVFPYLTYLDTEYEGDIFLGNVGLSQKYMALQLSEGSTLRQCSF
jgi:hypothetical protein